VYNKYMTGNEQYKFLDKVLVRTPFYSFRDYAPAQLEKVLERQDFRNAIWLASPEFYHILAKKDFDFSRINGKERYTLLKYYNRMSFRATPFGSFAAFGLARWSENQRLVLDKGADAILHLLPSLAFREAEFLSARTNCQDLLLSANPTLYRMGDEWRYTKSLKESSGKLSFSLQQIDCNMVNDFLIGRCAKKTAHANSLAAALIDQSGCSQEDAEDYIGFLLEEQVLFSEASASLAENDAPAQVASASEKSVNKYKLRVGLAGDLSRFKEKVQPFYAGLERQALKGGVDLAAQDKILPALRVLELLVPQFRIRDQRDFINAFKARFEAQKIPLLKALDPDTGISYGGLHRGVGNGLDNIRFPELKQARNELDWSAVHRMFLKIWLGNNRRDAFDAVVVDDDDLHGLEVSEPDLTLPPTMAILFTPVGNQLVLDAAGGASATALAGRFSVFSPEISALCREIAAAEAEANPGVIFAEIHQLSHGHVDNINRRGRIYDHIIPVNVFTGVDEEGVVFPDDLLISVVQDTIVLESVSLGRRVIPRLPTAYNYHHNELALFRFLCDLQFQGLRADLSFNPERLFPGLAFYPRIVYRNCIFSLARWHLSKEDISHLCAAPFSLGRLHLFRQEKGLPRLVSLGLSDQQLVFDLGHDAEALFFLKNLKEEKSSAVIREYLQPDNPVAMENKAIAAQVMAFVKHDGAVFAPLLQASGTQPESIGRIFPPGSEWLYVKLYCTPQSADKLLVEVITPLLANNKEDIACWFFVRYHDPDHHLRLRFLSKTGDASYLLRDIQGCLTSAGSNELVRDYRSDIYTREVERYTPELMADVEQYFSASSGMVLEILTNYRNGDYAAIELEAFGMVWSIALRFLSDLSSLAGFFERGKELFLREFSRAAKLNVDFDLKYRGISKLLEELLHGQPRADYTGSWLLMIENMDVLSAKTADWSKEKQDALLADLVHMQLNRLFASRQREYEAMVYYILHKYAASKHARQGQS
jgi:thiopeptide-type bacteriocin biosynthesis protein